MRSVTRLVCLLLIALTARAGAETYYVNKRGADANDGRGRGRAFLTVDKGVRALKPGDTLLIGPGEYFESVEVPFTGAQGKRTRIAAEVPRTAWLRGDEDVSGFRPAPGSDVVWELDWSGTVEAVNEVDSFTIYDRRATRVSLDYYASSWFHDPDAGKLYVRTSDSRPPTRHRITLVKKPAFGLRLDAGGTRKTWDVTIEGLVVSGFNSRKRQPWRPGYFSKWGLYINDATNCVIRDCVALLNGGGITCGHAVGSVIEKCVGYGNGAHGSPGGSIVIFGHAKDCVIRDCVAHDSSRAGIRFYAGNLENCAIRDCVSWNNAYEDFWHKGIHKKGDKGLYERCVTPGTIQSAFVKTRNCVAGNYHSFDAKKNAGYNLWLGKVGKRDVFADPGRFDYRPQADAPWRGKAPGGGDQGLPFKGDVFFLKPDGNDAASGDSVRAAWKTLSHAASRLKPGHTLYVLPGRYPGGASLRMRGTPEAPITLRGRSGKAVVFAGGRDGLTLTDSAHVALENLNWVGAQRAGLRLTRADDVRVKNCGFSGPVGVEAEQCARLHLSQNAFSNPTALRASKAKGLFLAGNVLQGGVELGDASREGLYSDYNCWPTTGDLAKWRAASGQDRHSLAHNVTFTAAAKGEFYLSDNSALAGRGPAGLTIGPYHLRRQTLETRIIGGGVRSVTATTANLEWRCNRNNVALVLRWGADPRSVKVLNLSGGSALRNVGLTGLRPGATYHYRLEVAPKPTFVLSQAPPRKPARRDFGKMRRFKTAKRDAPRRTYHVATDGKDTNNGLSRATAWRTVAHAAAEVKAGDTVQIRGGDYTEEIVLRATGDAGRPILFRNAPGEKVVFSGKGFLSTVWAIRRKSHVTLDGFHFDDPGQGAMSGVVAIRDCGDALVRRCFYDGRLLGNGPSLIAASGTRRVTLRNNVTISGFFFANISKCREFVIENNVAYIPSCLSMHVMGDKGARFVLRNNLFTDMISMKIRNPLFYFHEGDNTIVDECNCYFVRLPGALRPIYGFGPAQDRKRYTLDAFYKATGQPVTSFFANPGIKVLPAMRSYANLEAWRKKQGTKGGNERHYDRKTKTFAPLTRQDFLPANPKLRKAANGRPVGLDPSAFEKE